MCFCVWVLWTSPLKIFKNCLSYLRNLKITFIYDKLNLKCKKISDRSKKLISYKKKYTSTFLTIKNNLKPNILFYSCSPFFSNFFLQLFFGGLRAVVLDEGDIYFILLENTNTYFTPCLPLSPFFLKKLFLQLFFCCALWFSLKATSTLFYHQLFDEHVGAKQEAHKSAHKVKSNS